MQNNELKIVNLKESYKELINKLIKYEENKKYFKQLVFKIEPTQNEIEFMN
jgi:hypothetical protein